MVAHDPEAVEAIEAALDNRSVRAGVIRLQPGSHEAIALDILEALERRGLEVVRKAT